MSHLHQEALQAIREVLPSTYDDVADLWVELLLALPQAWRRYGHPCDENLAGEFGRFGFGPVDQAAKSLYMEAREVHGRHRRRSVHASRSNRAAEPRLRRARAAAANARLFVELYPTAADVENGWLCDRLLDLIYALPPQLDRSIEYSVHKIDLPASEHERATARLKLIFRTIAELAKAIADRDPADSARVGKIRSALRRVAT